MCIPLSLLGNGSVNTFLRQWIHAAVDEFLGACVCLYIPLSLLGNNSVKTFPRQRRNVGGVVFYAAHVVSKESRRLVLPTTSCFFLTEVSARSSAAHGQWCTGAPVCTHFGESFVWHCIINYAEKLLFFASLSLAYIRDDSLEHTATNICFYYLNLAGIAQSV
jgi:hypothetical protein